MHVSPARRNIVIVWEVRIFCGVPKNTLLQKSMKVDPQQSGTTERRLVGQDASQMAADGVHAQLKDLPTIERSM